VGAGTRVLLKIPSRYRIAAAPSTIDSALPQVPVAAARRARLILVEDNHGVRVATELFLKLEGHETLSAGSLAEAERLLEHLQPGDIVIADYHLDGRNTGLDMLLRLRERVGYDVPGIVLSGDLPSVIRSISAPVPACRFLSKPVDTTGLIDAIDQLGNAPSDQRGVG